MGKQGSTVRSISSLRWPSSRYGCGEMSCRGPVAHVTEVMRHRKPHPAYEILDEPGSAVKPIPPACSSSTGIFEGHMSIVGHRTHRKLRTELALIITQSNVTHQSLWASSCFAQTNRRAKISFVRKCGQGRFPLFLFRALEDGL